MAHIDSTHNQQQPMNKRPPGRPPSPRGPRTEIVKVSLHPDELQAILRLTNAPAQFLREAAMEVAGYTYIPKPTRKARAI
jgi:hypothetical protein